MKKLFSILAIVTLLGACCNNHKTNSGTATCSDQKEAAAITVDSFMTIAADYVGKEITVKGTVDHVCKHSGKRIKLVSASGQNFIFGLATEKVDTFKTDLEGSDICIIGKVIETKMDSICAPNCEAKASEMEHTECADHAANLDQTKKDQVETTASETANKVVYSISVTDYHTCALSNDDGCGHMNKANDDTTKACCGGKDEKKSDADKKVSGEESKPCCEKK